MPANFPGTTGNLRGWETKSFNGTAAGAFFEVNLTYYTTGNVTVWGPGPDTRCTSPYGVKIGAPTQYGGTSAWIVVPSNLSDKGEANNATLFTGFNDAVQSPAFFENGFQATNHASVSTCGGPSLLLPAGSTFLSVRFQLTLTGQVHSIPYVLPFTQDFTYYFPANFGTWQIDNLSAPGGPGGGWAFSYSPCS